MIIENKLKLKIVGSFLAARYITWEYEVLFRRLRKKNKQKQDVWKSHSNQQACKIFCFQNEIY